MRAAPVFDEGLAITMARDDGLGLGYRMWWNIRKTVLTFYGPAQLGNDNDPIRRLEREREAKVAEVARKKQG